MGFYVTTENPNQIMRKNHKTKSSEYIFICQDDLYTASTTPEEILHMLKDKSKINIYPQGKYPHDPGGRDICQIKEYLEKLNVNVNMLFSNKLPTDLYTTFQIMKSVIENGNLNLEHNKNHINNSIIYQANENWINYIMKCNSWTIKSHFTYLHYIHQISFYIQETSYMKWKANTV